MFKPKLVTLSVVVLTAAVIVAGCASSQPPAADGNQADEGPVSAPSQPAPVPTPTASPTQATTPTAPPTPDADSTKVPVPTTPTSLVAVPKLSKKVAGATKVRYFPIVGESPSQLVADTVLKSAKPCKSKVHDVLACVAWKGGGYRWITSTNLSTGSCKVTSLTIKKLTSTVNLPQWVGPARVQPALVVWWKQVLDHFAWHEGQHIKIEKSYEKKLRPLLIGHKCSSANKIIRRWEASLNAAQDKFDAKDYSWQPEWSVPYAVPQS